MVHEWVLLSTHPIWCYVDPETETTSTKESSSPDYHLALSH